MTAFDTVYDRLSFAVDRLVEARLACRAYAKPLRQVLGCDQKANDLYNDEHNALLGVVAAFHYAEQVAASKYSGDSSLDFEKRERRAARGDEVLTSNRDDAEGETRLEQLGRLYYNERERCRAASKVA